MPALAASPRRRWLVPAGCVFLLAVLAVSVWFFFGEHGYFAVRQRIKEIERLESEIQRLEEENRRLAAEIEALKNDPRAIERVAREELKMARPGEKIIALPPEKREAAGGGGEKKP